MNAYVSMPTRQISFRLQAGEGQEDVVALPKSAIDRSIVVGMHDPLACIPDYEDGANRLLAGDRWDSRRIFVTSPREGDGKTRTAFNLAAAMASAGKSVLLAEINFLQPRFRTVLGNLRFRYGIDCATSGAATPAESVFTVEHCGLHVTAVRKAMPAERLDRCLLHLNDYLDWANERYELLILDCPSILSPEWDRWFHAFVGHALLVVREDRTPMIDVRTAAGLLDGNLKAVWFNRSQQAPAELAHVMPAREMGAMAYSPRSLESMRMLSALMVPVSGGGMDADKNN
jgi:hypothetical protein